uniref:Uncharacterized protein n=1 Tax=Arundo donax TaxID=35708 RepID=A0A0A9H671_ARUDO
MPHLKKQVLKRINFFCVFATYTMTCWCTSENRQFADGNYQTVVICQNTH